MMIGFVWQSRRGSTVHSVRLPDDVMVDVRNLWAKRSLCGVLPREGWQNAGAAEPGHLHGCWTCFHKRTLMLPAVAFV